VLFTLYAAVRWFLLWNESMNPDREN
jgi:hypothetical protein